MDVERRAERARAGQEPRDERGAGEDEREARHEEEPARRVEEEEAQVPPAVAPRAEVRRPRPAVPAERDGNLADHEAEERRLDDHLARVLHPGRPQVEALERVAAEGAEAAVEVRDVGAEEETAEAGQDRVSEPAVERRHRALLDRARGSASP